MLVSAYGAILATGLLDVAEAAATAGALVPLWHWGRARRAQRLLAALALVMMLAATVFATPAVFFLAAAFFAACAVAMLLSGEILRAQSRSSTVAGALPAVRGLIVSAVFVTVVICALGLCLFLILPRTAQAAFRHLRPPRAAATGFGRVVEVGRAEAIKQPNYSVFHVRQFTGVPPLSTLKWRGVVLTDFDGRRWTAPAESGEVLHPDRGLIRVADNDQRRRAGSRVSYEVRLRGVNSDALFIAGTPEFLQLPAPYALLSSTGVLRPGLASLDGLRYGVHAFLETASANAEMPAQQIFDAGVLDPDVKQRYLRLPDVDPRVARAAIALGGPEEIEQHLRSSYTYSLDGAPATDGDPLAAFLFDRRAGHCEEFASAMAVLLRLKYVPARVVTGFRFATYNPISGWYYVSASSAHAWVEAWVSGKGWVTYDPTPALPDSSPQWLTQIGYWTDAADLLWQDWVLGYNLENQLGLAARLEQSRYTLGVNWQAMARGFAQAMGSRLLFAAGGVVLAVAFAIWLWRRRRAGGGSAALSEPGRLYERFLALMRSRGFERPLSMTAAEFAAGLPAPELRDEARQLTLAYQAARFGNQPASIAVMRGVLKRLQAARPLDQREAAVHRE